MENNKLDLIIKELGSLKYYRGSRFRGSGLNSLIYNDFQKAYQEVYWKHCGYGLGLTISRLDLNAMGLKESWEDVPRLLDECMVAIKKSCLVIGVLGGVEMYQKSVRSSKKGRALKPHIHVMVFCYNGFLKLPLYKLESNLRDLKLDYRVERIKSFGDAARWMRYCTKNYKDDLLQRICEPIFGRSVFLFYNKTMDVTCFRHIEESLGIKGWGVDYVVKVISCARQNDLGLQAGTFIRAQCLYSGIGLFKGKLCKRKSNALFTWSAYMEIPDFVNMLSKLEAQADFLVSLKAAGGLDTGYGLLNKDSSLQVYPKIDYKSYFWEFANGIVYDAQQGIILNGNNLLNRFISCGKFHNCDFNKLPVPINVLRILDDICAKEDQIMLLNGIAHLWHEVGWEGMTRKDIPGLYLYGEPSTFKTKFIKKLLENTFEEVLIHTVGQYGESSESSRFALSLLKGVSVGIMFVDDIKLSSNIVKFPGRFTNLIDGNTVTYEEKYKNPVGLNYRGGYAITSNYKLNKLFGENFVALKKRFRNIRFTRSTKDIGRAIDDLDSLELASFVVFCNTLFLQEHNKKGVLPESWLSSSGDDTKWLSSSGDDTKWLSSSGDDAKWLRNSGDDIKWLSSSLDDKKWLSSWMADIKGVMFSNRLSERSEQNLGRLLDAPSSNSGPAMTAECADEKVVLPIKRKMKKRLLKKKMTKKEN